MDEEILLDLLVEYQGNWKDRQYYEHVVREIQKKQHLSQLILEHKHDPRDQLMLEASKRKTVVEIEKKFKVSTINNSYQFPRNNLQSKKNKQQDNAQEQNGVEESNEDEDSHNNSLDVDFYNLKAQNVSKNKKQKAIQNNETNKTSQIPSQNSKTNVNQLQQQNDNNSQSQIYHPSIQQKISAGPQTQQNNQNIKNVPTANFKAEIINKISNNENQALINNQNKDEIDKNQKLVKNILNSSSDKNQTFNKNNNSNVQPMSLNNNNLQSQANQMKNIPQGQQQSNQNTILQNQTNLQQQAILKANQEESIQNESNKINHENKEQTVSDSNNNIGTRLNTYTNDVEKNPETIKVQKQTKSSSNSPMNKINGQVQNINNYYYLSPQTNQQQSKQQVIQNLQNTQQSLIKSNKNLLNQQQQQKGNNTLNIQVEKNDIQSEFKSKIQQQFTTTNQKNQNSVAGLNKNQNLSSGSGKDTQIGQKQILGGTNQKEIVKHSNTIESILYNQQQQHYTYLNQPHQILNTQESANGNEDSQFSMNQTLQQTLKSQLYDNDQVQIIKQIQNQQQNNQNNIYNSKKLYQLDSNNQNSQQIQQAQSQLLSQQNSLSTHNKQRKLISQNGVQNNINNIQQSNSPKGSNSQLNSLTHNFQMQYKDSSENVSNQIQPNGMITNSQQAYLNDNVLSTQPYSEQQTSTNPLNINSEDILSQNSLAIDTQRKSSIRSKKSGISNSNPHQDDQENRLITGTALNHGVGGNLQFSQANSSQYKNKWIDFKKINQQYKGSDRVSNPEQNQTQYEDNGQTMAQNVRNTFNSVSPNGHQSQSNNNKKTSNSINNYLSLSTAINNIGNSTSSQNNPNTKIKQGLTNSISQQNHYQNNSNLTKQASFTKQSSHNQNQASNLISHLNNQQQLHSSQEFAAYQIKSGKVGLTENQSVDKNFHTQFINNAKQFHQQQQQFLLQQSQAIDDPQSQNFAALSTNGQRKQINKVNSCKGFEIRDKFSKITNKNNTNNPNINLSNVNNSNSNHPNQLYVQNLNHTTGNHNMSNLTYNNNSSNMNSSINPSTNIGSALNNNNSSSKQNLLSSSNIISYLPSSQAKNTYSAALYQKSQNNILSKQAKNPTDSSVKNLFNSIQSNNQNNILSTSNGGGTNGMNSTLYQGRNTSQNPSSSITQSMNNMNLNSYLTNHNQNQNTKLAKKIDMYKVFNSTNSNSFSNQKDTQQSSTKQVKNLGLVLQKIIKNQTLKINEKGNQLNQQIQMNSSIQNNIISNNNTNHQNNQPLKKQSSPKKIISTQGNAQQQLQNNAINNQSIKSPQYQSQQKKNYI